MPIAEVGPEQCVDWGGIGFEADHRSCSSSGDPLFELNFQELHHSDAILSSIMPSVSRLSLHTHLSLDTAKLSSGGWFTSTVVVADPQSGP